MCFIKKSPMRGIFIRAQLRQPGKLMHMFRMICTLMNQLRICHLHPQISHQPDTFPYNCDIQCIYSDLFYKPFFSLFKLFTVKQT